VDLPSTHTEASPGGRLGKKTIPSIFFYFKRFIDGWMKLHLQPGTIFVQIAGIETHPLLETMGRGQR
jgi:hypothetical protein